MICDCNADSEFGTKPDGTEGCNCNAEGAEVDQDTKQCECTREGEYVKITPADGDTKEVRACTCPEGSSAGPNVDFSKEICKCDVANEYINANRGIDDNGDAYPPICECPAYSTNAVVDGDSAAKGLCECAAGLQFKTPKLNASDPEECVCANSGTLTDDGEGNPVCTCTGGTILDDTTDPENPVCVCEIESTIKVDGVCVCPLRAKHANDPSSEPEVTDPVTTKSDWAKCECPYNLHLNEAGDECICPERSYFVANEDNDGGECTCDNWDMRIFKNEEGLYESECKCPEGSIENEYKTGCECYAQASGAWVNEART